MGDSDRRRTCVRHLGTNTCSSSREASAEIACGVTAGRMQRQHGDRHCLRLRVAAVRRAARGIDRGRVLLGAGCAELVLRRDRTVAGASTVPSGRPVPIPPRSRPSHGGSGMWLGRPSAVSVSASSVTTSRSRSNERGGRRAVSRPPLQPLARRRRGHERGRIGRSPSAAAGDRTQTARDSIWPLHVFDEVVDHSAEVALLRDLYVHATS
jgi:hypothetical protein